MLTKRQIVLVKEKITSGGVTTPELIEDLLDHLCTSIETEIDSGLSFEAALDKTFSQLTEDELKLTEMETQEALEGKEIYYPNLTQSVGLVGAMWVAFFFIVVVGSSLVRAFGLNAYMTLFNLSLQYLILGGVIALAANWIRESQRGQIFSFTKLPTYVYAILFIISLLMTFWVDPLGQFSLLSRQALKTYIDSLTSFGISPILVSFSLAFLSELLFRGIILKGLLKTLTPAWAIFWSSVLAVTINYAAVTINYANPLLTFTLNISMGWIYWKTKSLSATLFMMFTWLGVSMLTFYLLGNRTEILIGFSWRALFSNFNLYVTLIVLALLLTFGLFYYLHKKLSTTVTT